MYEQPDRSYLDEPIVMSEEVVAQAGLRIAEHLDDHGIDSIVIDLHGGEPLLALRKDPQYLSHFTGILNGAIGKDRITYNIQTNGSLLSEDTMKKLTEAGIDNIGISIDGDKATHDAHRIKNKRSRTGTFDEVAKGIRTAIEYRKQTGLLDRIKLLCVMNPASDPEAVYQTLTGFEGVDELDFLFPFGNHTNLPPFKSKNAGGSQSPTPYADWLAPMYKRWKQQDGLRINVPLFDALERLIRKKPDQEVVSREYVGTSVARLLVIEPSGTMKGSESLRATNAEGSTLGGLNVFSNTIDEAAKHPKVAQQYLGTAVLSEQCKQCTIVDQCGGGLPASRWKAYSAPRTGGDFNNPSVFCEDYTALFTQAAQLTLQDLKTIQLMRQSPDPQASIVLRNESLKRLRDVVDRATEGLITAESAVWHIAALGYFAIGTTKPQDVHTPAVPLTFVEGIGWRPTVNAKGGTIPVIRAGNRPALAVLAAVAGDHSQPFEGKAVQLLGEDRVYHQGLLGWCYDPRRGTYLPRIHSDLKNAIERTSTRNNLGFIDIVRRSPGHSLSIDDEPGQIAFTASQETISSLPVRAGNVRLLFNKFPFKLVDYRPLPA
jgi:uncharacterized protein